MIGAFNFRSLALSVFPFFELFQKFEDELETLFAKNVEKWFFFDAKS